MGARVSRLRFLIGLAKGVSDLASHQDAFTAPAVVSVLLSFADVGDGTNRTSRPTLPRRQTSGGPG